MSNFKERIQETINSTISIKGAYQNLNEMVYELFTTAGIKKELENEFLNTHSQIYKMLKNSYNNEGLLKIVEELIVIRSKDKKFERGEILPSFMRQLEGVQTLDEGLFFEDKIYYQIKYLDKVNDILPCINPYQIRESEGVYKLYMTGGNGACSTLREIFYMFSDTPTQQEVSKLTGVKDIILKRTKVTNGYRYTIASSNHKKLIDFAEYLLNGSPFKGTKISRKQYEYLLDMLEHFSSMKLRFVSDLLVDYLKLVTIKD